MDGHVTIRNIQAYVKVRDSHPDKKMGYILKFMEESGELAKAIFEELPHAEGDNIKNTIEEEFCDVLYFLLALANIHDVDIEKWFPVKMREADRKHGFPNFFDENFEFVK